MSVVEVRGLTIRIPTRAHGRRAWVHAATDVDLQLEPGRVHALVGESGCGKSILASALVGMLPRGTRCSGTVSIGGRDMSQALVDSDDVAWRGVRGRVVGRVPQSSATFLTPTRTVGSQLEETLRVLGAGSTAGELLERVQLPREALGLYPHELSGGMAGRAAVAFALAGEPDVVVADEPTASLDADLTRHVLSLLRGCADAGTAVLVITHDLASLLETGVADDLSVEYAGRIVDHGPADRLLNEPQVDYTRALVAALPQHGLTAVPGMPPSLTDLDEGVTFADRLERTGTEAT